jgi:hypothetical protein
MKNRRKYHKNARLTKTKDNKCNTNGSQKILKKELFKLFYFIVTGIVFIHLTSPLRASTKTVRHGV